MSASDSDFDSDSDELESSSLFLDRLIITETDAGPTTKQHTTERPTDGHPTTERPTEHVDFYRSFPNASDFANVLILLEKNDNNVTNMLWHRYEFQGYVLTRVDNNYIISKRDTNNIISVMHDPNTLYRIGDRRTHYYQNRNGDLTVWNDGVVCSVVRIRIPRSKKSLSYLLSFEYPLR